MRATGSMRRPSPLRSGAFRFAIMIAAIFAVGTIALLIMVQKSVNSYATEVAADSVTTESSVLRDQDRTAGRTQLIRSILRRERVAREHQLLYLLEDEQRHWLAGGLPTGAAHLGWRDLSLPNPVPRNDDGSTRVSLMALGIRLDDGAILVVASDRSDLDDLRRGLGMATAAFGLTITLFALIGGFAVGTIFLRRLDRVNRSIQRIVQGNLTERLPAIGMSSEFDQLSGNLNLMLDRIGALMEGLRQVSTDIAHDLRTPLTRLRQRLEDMRSALRGSASEDQLEAALKQTDAILSIFRALLRISSLEAGSGPRLAAVDLSSLVDRVFKAYVPVAEDAGHTLTADIATGIAVPGDAELLAQAITNLIENSLLHTLSGSAIVLLLSHEEDGPLLVIADNGLGIPEEEREKVLRRFYRLDSSRGSPGAGLGLALVTAIVSIHRARLRLLENNPGLRVEVHLPS